MVDANDPKPLKEDGTLDDKPYTMEELKAQGKTKKQLKKVAKDRLKRFLTCVDYNSNGVVDMPEILALFGYFEKEKRDAGDEESAKKFFVMGNAFGTWLSMECKGKGSDPPIAKVLKKRTR